jgi:hypothetical protein
VLQGRRACAKRQNGIARGTEAVFDPQKNASSANGRNKREQGQAVAQSRPKRHAP